MVIKEILGRILKFVDDHKSTWKGVKAFVFLGVVFGLDSFIQSFLTTEYATITLGALVILASNWIKHNVLN